MLFPLCNRYLLLAFRAFLSATLLHLLFFPLIVFLDLHFRLKSISHNDLTSSSALCGLASRHGCLRLCGHARRRHAHDLLVFLDLLADLVLDLLFFFVFKPQLFFLFLGFHLLVIVKIDFLNDYEIMPVYIRINLHHLIVLCWVWVSLEARSLFALMFFILPFIPQIALSRGFQDLYSFFLIKL